MTENRSHWQAYVDLLVKNGVSQKFQRYYVGHAELFMQFMKGRPLSQLTVEDVQLFLQNASLQTWLELWQFEQIVDVKRPKKLLSVLSRNEVNSILNELNPQAGLMVGLLYSAGIDGAFGCEYHHDLHPCAEQTRCVG